MAQPEEKRQDVKDEVVADVDHRCEDIDERGPRRLVQVRLEPGAGYDAEQRRLQIDDVGVVDGDTRLIRQGA